MTDGAGSRRGPGQGRPSIGNPVNVALGDQLDPLDDYVKRHRLRSRADGVRLAIASLIERERLAAEWTARAAELGEGDVRGEVLGACARELIERNG